MGNKINFPFLMIIIIFLISPTGYYSNIVTGGSNEQKRLRNGDFLIYDGLLTPTLDSYPIINTNMTFTNSLDQYPPFIKQSSSDLYYMIRSISEQSPMDEINYTLIQDGYYDGYTGMVTAIDYRFDINKTLFQEKYSSFNWPNSTIFHSLNIYKDFNPYSRKSVNQTIITSSSKNYPIKLDNGTTVFSKGYSQVQSKGNYFKYLGAIEWKIGNITLMVDEYEYGTNYYALYESMFCQGYSTTYISDGTKISTIVQYNGTHQIYNFSYTYTNGTISDSILIQSIDDIIEYLENRVDYFGKPFPMIDKEGKILFSEDMMAVVEIFNFQDYSILKLVDFSITDFSVPSPSTSSTTSLMTTTSSTTSTETSISIKGAIPLLGMVAIIEILRRRYRIKSN